MRHAGEPSVEEILESIKKVIARDNRAEADQLRRRREQQGVTPAARREAAPRVALAVEDYADDYASFSAPAHRAFDDDDDRAVLELTEADAAPDGGMREPSARSENPMADDETPQFAQETSEEEAGQEDDGREAPESPLLAANTRASMRDSLTALAMLAEPGAQPQIVRSGETSLEGLTRDLLRPMLAQWLDQNLPPMVERMVAAEIARIAGKRG
ncbi:DUF2497 domain-containing protein [Novosphingobium tardum]|uniref:DUF2497 domain-containing protein n=1 Tax=Novosphingobium tardum TaxID=1538021 RepID=A0ABV8RM71_9SPHN